MDLDWLIAVVLAALSAFISNLGVTLQKLHHINDKDKLTSPSQSAKPSPNNHKHNQIHREEKSNWNAQHQQDEEIVDVDTHEEEDLHLDEPSSPPLSPSASNHYTASFTWRIGLALVIFGSLFDLAALRFGPQSLVAPLGSLTLVSNICFARLLLKEKVDRHDMIATGLIICGSTLAVAFGKHGQPDFTADQLFASFLRADFIIYACCVIAAAWTLYVKVRAIEKVEADCGVDSDEYRPFRAAHRFSYPSLAGIIGAQSVLFAKCSIELIFAKAEVPAEDADDSLTDGDDSTPTLVTSYFTALLNPVTWIVIAIMFVSIFLQIKFLNDGLKRFSSTYSIPVFQAFWIVVSVVSGMIFYEEYRGLTATHISMFCIGVLISVTGVGMLTSRDHSHGQIPIPTEDLDENIEIELQHTNGTHVASSNGRSNSSSDFIDSNEDHASSMGFVSAANLKAILNSERRASRSASASNESSNSVFLESDDEELAHFEHRTMLNGGVHSDAISIVSR